MALFCGDKKIRLNIGRYAVDLKLYTSDTPITSNIRLLSSDGFCLKDSVGIYLTVNEEEE